MKKTLNENNSIETNWKTILLVLASTVVGGFILIFSLFKSIENTQQIKVDPLADANQLTKKQIEIFSNDESFYYDVYIADDEESRATGLMNIKTLPENEGMLFIFPDSQLRSFWMKNTYLPLDIIFFDSSMKFINSHENAQPLNESLRYNSEEPAKYALELNAGMAERLELNSESTLIIVD